MADCSRLASAHASCATIHSKLKWHSFFALKHLDNHQIHLHSSISRTVKSTKMQLTKILAVAVLLASSTVASPAADARAPSFSSVKPTTTTTTPNTTPRHPPRPQKPPSSIPVKKCEGGYDSYCCSTDPLNRHPCFVLSKKLSSELVSQDPLVLTFRLSPSFNYYFTNQPFSM